MGATLLNYAIAVTGVVLLYVYFTHVSLTFNRNIFFVEVNLNYYFLYMFISYLYFQPYECALNKFFISFNLILCIIISIISILPSVQKHQPHSGLLQPSIVSLYVIYLTWSGVSNSPGIKYTSYVKLIRNIYKAFLFIFLNYTYRSHL